MNNFILRFKASQNNIMFSRIVISGFLVYLDPSVEDINDIKTAVSEAVTNATLHAYGDRGGEIEIECEEKNREVVIKVRDFGCGIENTEKAREAFYSKSTDIERAGLGFTVMETFMDKIEVNSKLNIGTEIIMYKELK